MGREKLLFKTANNFINVNHRLTKLWALTMNDCTEIATYRLLPIVSANCL